MLEVEHLSVTFRRDGKVFRPVRDVSFHVGKGERVALVGESGCGKSLTALSLRRLSPTDRAEIGGRITCHGRIAYVFQNPMESLNPVMRIGAQIAEAAPHLSRHEIVALLARTGLPDPIRAERAYPCELSGGQQQRAMIAMALAARPDLLVADEPTTALDVTTQREVLDLIDTLADETGMAVLFITHNLGLVAGRMDRVNVMYAGTIVEAGPVMDVLSAPRHPYARGLLQAVPALDAPRDAALRDIPGTVPPSDAWPSGCAFHPRCPDADEHCRQACPVFHPCGLQRGMACHEPRYCGRLAPSPTGALHLGNIRTFMVAWLRARSAGGRLIFRMEDLDHPRDKPESAETLREELRWLGFEWDEEFVQSTRHRQYATALMRLKEAGLVYPCICSRKDVERAQSAPHEGEQLFYPGTCRGRFATWEEAAILHPPCWRFHVDAATKPITFDDVFAGSYTQDVSKVLGDFPLSRDADGAGYMLASVTDDAEMGITEVVRGDDLLPVTPAQILLQRALGLPTPAYCHIPLVVGPDGHRLAKRHGDTRVAAFRAAGRTPEEIIGYLAASLGLAEKGERVTLDALLPRFAFTKIPRERVVCAPADLHFSRDCTGVN